MRRQVKLEAGLDDGCADGIVAAAGTKRRNRTLVIAVRQAERIRGQRMVMKLGFSDIGHVDVSGRRLRAICGYDPTLRKGVTLLTSRRSAIEWVISRAV